MSRDTLNAQFWKACKILRQDDNTNSLLDYVEQISWLLFLKCLEELERRNKAEAEFEGKPYTPILAKKYQWSTWTCQEKHLTGQDLMRFLTDDLFPYLRTLKGNSAKSVIRALFEETPSKMLKDGGILRDAIDEIGKIEFETADDVHTLSHLYESMLAKLGREGGMGGEFYTPRPIIEFIVKMVAPQIGETIYDPAMGSAGFLVESYKHMRKSLGNKILPRDEKRLQENTFYGQEKKPLPYLLGCMNMILHGVFSSNLTRRNTLGDDIRKFTEKDRFNVILTNPPFGGTEHDSVTSNFRYPSKATSITFLQHIMAKVKRGGRVGMVIDETVLSKTNELAYINTRKELLEVFNLHTIISLPAGVFANAVSTGTGPKTNLIFFNRELDKSGNPIGTKEIWYYEVEAVGFTLTKTQKPIKENDLPECLRLANNKKQTNRSWTVDISKIRERNYNLSAFNPNQNDELKHKTPTTVAGVLISKTKSFAESLEKIQESLSTTNQDELPTAACVKWVEMPLEKFIKQRKDYIILEDDKNYKRVTVQLHAKGIVPRDEIYGKNIKTKKQYPIKANDLLVAEIDAKVGGYGIVPIELEGAIVSNHYYLYEVDESQLEINYLYFWLQTPSPLNQIQYFIKGALNYAAIRPYHFSKLKIPIPIRDNKPDINEQKNVSSFLKNTLTLNIYHKQIKEELDVLFPSLLDKAFKGEL